MSPVSTPGGTLTDSVFSFCTRPWPAHLGHGSVMTLPLPRHVGQACCTLKKPCCMRTCPAPWQVWQVLGWVPRLAPEPSQVSQATRFGMRSSVDLPATASSRLISRLYCRSSPR